jgi:cytochrome c553
MLQIDQADLDFGNYRIMNAKWDEITRFQEQDLLTTLRTCWARSAAKVSSGWKQELLPLDGPVSDDKAKVRLYPCRQEMFARVCMSIRLFVASLVTLSGCLTLSFAQAADNTERVRQVVSSASEFDNARKAGKKAAFFCVNCHGESGNSTYDYIPNLAGQNAVYLLNQIEKFADGRRQDEFMSGMIKAIKPEDRFNMAIYYSAQSVKPGPSGVPALVAKGKQTYTVMCQHCHGTQGYGNEKIARLAGQQPVYIKKSLEAYRLGAKDRKDPIMGSIARRLKDADIAALAAYIPTMR